MALAGTSYTAAVGISSTSSTATTVASLSNTVAGGVIIKGYSTAYKVTISGAVSNSVGVMDIYANSTLSSTISNSGTVYINNGATVSGTTTNTGYFYTAGTVGAVTNNAGGTV